ncbi:MAG: hypothetical protein ACRYG7_29200 [Janthinobacterium lividum]
MLRALGLGMVLLASPAAAQTPAAGLVGRWEMRQISFVATHAVAPELLARMDNPEVAALNQAVAAGEARLLVEFSPNGTYQFQISRAGQPNHLETGTYQLRADTLLAQSIGSPGGSSFHDQHVVQLTRRKLVVEFLVGNDLPGIIEEIEYRRAR